MSSVDTGEWRDIPRGGRPFENVSGTRALCRCADPGPGHGPELEGACRPFWAWPPTKHSLVGWGDLGGCHLPATAPTASTEWGAHTPFLAPSAPAETPPPRSTRSPDPVRLLSQTTPPQPHFADTPHGALVPLESSFQRSASSADNSSEGQLMSKVAPFPTRLSPSTCPLQCAAARQRHSREPFGPTHLLLMA